MRHSMPNIVASIPLTDDPASDVQIVGWRVSVACRLNDASPGRLQGPTARATPTAPRRMVYPNGAAVTAKVYDWFALSERPLSGPAIVESPLTTVVIDDATFFRSPVGSLVIDL